MGFFQILLINMKDVPRNSFCETCVVRITWILYGKKVVRCTAPWSGINIQRLSPISMSPSAQSLHESLRVLSWFGIGHRLFDKKDPTMRFRYLTHLYADNPDIFYSLLYHAFKNVGKREFLVYPHFDGNLLTLPPRFFISANTQCGMYSILPPNQVPADFLMPTLANEPPDFELAYL